jgi:Sulfotransferase domain
MKLPAIVLIIIGSFVQVVPSKVADEPKKQPFKHTDIHTGKYGLRPYTNATKFEKRRQGGTLPTIFIVGAQKGGSSSLYELMIEHPKLCTGLHKENHFFDHQENYEMGTNYFREMYSDPKCDHIAGAHFVDATPTLHYPSTWQRIYDTYTESPIIRDNLKFIALLREPTAREFSWYQHSTRTG